MAQRFVSRQGCLTSNYKQLVSSYSTSLKKHGGQVDAMFKLDGLKEQLRIDVLFITSCGRETVIAGRLNQNSSFRGCFLVAYLSPPPSNQPSSLCGHIAIDVQQSLHFDRSPDLTVDERSEALLKNLWSIDGLRRKQI